MSETTDDFQPSGPRCWQQHEFMGAVHTCERPLDHEGDHGSGFFVEYSLMWPGDQP